VFIAADVPETGVRMSEVTRWWLRRSLGRLDEAFRARGSRLIVRTGPALRVLRGLIQETGAAAVYWNRAYEPEVVARDTAVKQALLDAGIEARSFAAALLHEPTRVQNQSGQPFQVFTAFWKHCSVLPVRERVESDQPRFAAPTAWPRGETLDEAMPGDGSPAERLGDFWDPGEAGARAVFDGFMDHGLAHYARDRDFPARGGTSRLSPHVHWGEISVIEIWHGVRAIGEGRDAATFLKELGWRDFAHHLLFHFPRTVTEPLRPEFARFPWEPDETRLQAWQRGETGYPIVDAGMRQLARTGWMHNRVRMVVASFLVKHLLQPWTAGAAWFAEKLVDADLANNTLGWQWAAGSGADAAPYFRVFNPVLQGRKFDPEGDYVREFVPELRELPAAHMHAPWEAPAAVLTGAGVRLEENYPRPIVEHREARGNALAAYARMRA
jgi:deoxyribodipyrimidine photo-lyase